MSDNKKINSSRNSFTNKKANDNNTSSWKVVLERYSKNLTEKKQKNNQKSLSKTKDNKQNGPTNIIHHSKLIKKLILYLINFLGEINSFSNQNIKDPKISEKNITGKSYKFPVSNFIKEETFEYSKNSINNITEFNTSQNKNYSNNYLNSFLNTKKENNLSNSFLNYNSSTKDKLEKSFNNNCEHYPPYLKYENKSNNNTNISLNSFNYDSKGNFISNFPQEKEIIYNEEEMSMIPRNYSDLNRYLLFSDENININDNENNNYNSTKNYSFEKMTIKKSASNFRKNNFPNTGRKNIKKSNSLNNNLINKKTKSKNSNYIKEIKNFLPSHKNRIKNFDENSENKNPIEHYFQKRHLAEAQKLDNLRHEKNQKEISELKEKPTISINSKKLLQHKIKFENFEGNEKEGKNVFERLIGPAQVK